MQYVICCSTTNVLFGMFSPIQWHEGSSTVYKEQETFIPFCRYFKDLVHNTVDSLIFTNLFEQKVQHFYAMVKLFLCFNLCSAFECCYRYQRFINKLLLLLLFLFCSFKNNKGLSAKCQRVVAFLSSASTHKIKRAAKLRGTRIPSPWS